MVFVYIVSVQWTAVSISRNRDCMEGHGTFGVTPGVVFIQGPKVVGKQ